MNPSHKPKYISKAERAKLDAKAADSAAALESREAQSRPGDEHER